MTYKAMYKYELASAAGVSNDTFRRWLISDRAVFEAMGISPTQHLLPPVAVRFICETLEIDLS